jgi:hypothetical protein
MELDVIMLKGPSVIMFQKPKGLFRPIKGLLDLYMKV